MNSPTRVRYSILFLLCLLAMITYMDRAMYGKAKGDLMGAVGQPETKFFYVLTAFQLAYALFEIPAGWLGDRFGPRITLLRIVVWWSLFVGLTGLAGYAFPGTEFIVIGFGVLILMQFLFGMGEAGAFPNISKGVYNWFPESQRGFAKGAVWMSARLMGGLTPMIWVLLTSIVGLSWRQTLGLFAALALLWCLAFALWFRNKPEEHPAVNDAERAIINAGRKPATKYDGTPWKAIFLNRNVIALCLMYTVTNYNWYFLMYYLPGFFKDQFKELNTPGAGELLVALLGGAPLLIGMFGCYLGGVLSDRMIRRSGNRGWGRRIVPMFGYGLAGVCYFAAMFTIPPNRSPVDEAERVLFLQLAMGMATCLILVGFFNDLIMGPSWAASQDIGGRYSAIVGGTMNMVGNLGAALGNFITGLILEAHTLPDQKKPEPSGFVVCFIMYGVVYFLGVFAWLFIDAGKSIDQAEAKA